MSYQNSATNQIITDAKYATLTEEEKLKFKKYKKPQPKARLTTATVAKEKGNEADGAGGTIQ